MVLKPNQESKQPKILNSPAPSSLLSDILVRPAENKDLVSASLLLERSGLSPDGLKEHVETMLVAVYEDVIVGTAALEMYGKAALLRSVSVDVAARKIGLGIQLTIEILKLAKISGVRRVFLLTETASDFFPRFGFHLVSRGDVPAHVKSSIEFTSLCPDSAHTMELILE